MAEVASRELRNDTRSVLRRVEAGEHVVVTVDGRAVAEIAPLRDRLSWLPRERFLRLLQAQADPALAADLKVLAPDMTDDLTEW